MFLKPSQLSSPGAALLLASTGLLAAFACSSESSPPSTGTGGATAGAAGQSTSGSGGATGGNSTGGVAASAGASGSTAGGCAAVPDGVPECWQRLEYPPGVGNCDVYYPGPGAELPPAIEWEDLDLPTQPAVTARSMRLATEEGDFDLNSLNYGWYDEARSASVLSFIRDFSDTKRYRILAESDGAVLNATLSIHPRGKTCELAPQPVSSENFLLRVVPQRDNTFQGALHWPFGSTSAPTVIHREDEHPSEWRMSDRYVVRWSNGVYVRNPGTTMWRESTGTIPFVRFEANSARGTSNLATDGHDWAWTEATRDGKGGWENYELFTAPYSLDPAQVRAQARRIGSEPTWWASETFYPVVGCGYRARVHSAGSQVLVVTRLSDGHHWDVVGSVANPPIVSHTLAIDCDAVYVVALPSGIARIRLSDLGPGAPAN